MNYINQYILEEIKILELLDQSKIQSTLDLLIQLRARGGRLFFLGIGGGAGHASHAVNDFRKLAGFEAYAPTDNVSELTARTNDDGWDTVFLRWLEGSRLTTKDCLFVFSVGGGNVEKKISQPLVIALAYGR